MLGKLIVYTEPTHRLEALKDLVQVSAGCSASTHNQPVFPAFPPADHTNRQEPATEERRGEEKSGEERRGEEWRGEERRGEERREEWRGEERRDRQERLQKAGGR